MALKHNGKGKLDTVEFLDPIYLRACERMRAMQLGDYVTCYKMDVARFDPERDARVSSYDMILLDTEPQTRFAELVKFYPYLNEGGFIFIHDLHRGMCQGNINPDWPNLPSWPFGDLPVTIKSWVKEGKLRSFHFSTPRGLTGFYKPHKDDYDWSKDTK